MSRFKAFALASCVGLFGAAFAPSLNADQWNKRTILTVNEAIQVPNKVLEPGKYVMKLLDSPSNRHIVQIFDENEQHLITTVLAIPNYRLQPTGETQFGFWETPAGQPKALRSWFYPGDNFGQEFAYPKTEAMRIAAVTNQAVPTTYAQSEADLTTARVGTVDQVGTEKELDQNTYSNNNQATASNTQEQAASNTQEAASNTQEAPTATVAEQPAQPQPAQQNTEMAQNRTTPTDNTADRAATPAPMPATPAATPQSMPRTASPYPAIGLIGLLSIAAFGAATVFAKRSI